MDVDQFIISIDSKHMKKKKKMLLYIVFIFLINFINDTTCTEKQLVASTSTRYSFSELIESVYPHLTWSNGTIKDFHLEIDSVPKEGEINCFGLGSTISKIFQWAFLNNHGNVLDVKFFLTSRRQPRRVEVVLGDQFGLEWTDFKIKRTTVLIVHGFLSHGNETWIVEMERAFLQWSDVNVVVVDWSAHGNTWNYYKAAVNAQTAGERINQFLSQIVNDTKITGGDEINWGSIHMVGHSLGAHICGLAADEFKKLSTPWKVRRITGLDPAQPCIAHTDYALDQGDADFVDIIHTNGRLLKKLGFGLPHAIGHVDFYPNGGRSQPGCALLEKYNPAYYLGIPRTAVQEAICSHGRSYRYFTASLVAAANQNGTFWGHFWDGTYMQAIEIMNKTCDKHNCIEMGINAANYPNRGKFFVMTSSTEPFSELSNEDKNSLSEQLLHDFQGEVFD